MNKNQILGTIIVAGALSLYSAAVSYKIQVDQLQKRNQYLGVKLQVMGKIAEDAYMRLTTEEKRALSNKWSNDMEFVDIIKENFQ